MYDTAKMIYQDEAIARMILAKMQQRHPNGGWEITTVHNGHQVRSTIEKVLVKTDLGHGNPHMISVEPVSSDTASAKLLKGIVGNPVKAGEQQVFVKLAYVKQSPQFLEVKNAGKTTWVQKSCVTKWDVNHLYNTVLIQLPLSYAKKRGFAYAYKLEDL